MKIKINEKFNSFSKDEKKLIYEVFYTMMNDIEEKEVLEKFFECIGIE